MKNYALIIFEELSMDERFFYLIWYDRQLEFYESIQKKEFLPLCFPVSFKVN